MGFYGIIDDDYSKCTAYYAALPTESECNCGGGCFLHVISKEKSFDQDGLNQAHVKSVCKAKCFPLLIRMTEQTLSVRVQN